MRSLRLKLIFTFLIISIAGTLITALVVQSSNERAFDNLRKEQEQADFIDDMLAYYQTNGSWQNIASIQDGGHETWQEDGAPEKFLPYALADENGRIVLPDRHLTEGSIVPADLLAKGIPLELDGVQIGTVLPDDQPPPRNPAEVEFLAETNRALFIGAGGATAVAILLAIIMARTLTRPLQELSDASRQMAQGNLQQTVPVRTQDELGELALAFNQMSDELERVNKIRRQMTADIAHDLRSPLTVLSGYLEAMEDGSLSPTPARLALMQQEVQTLQRLVTDLRTLSLADTGKLALQKEAAAISGLLSQVHDTFAHQASQQEISLLLDIEVALPEIPFDISRMRQVLSNLVSNALRYTPIGGTVTLSARQTDAGLQILVSDTGSGIPEADLPYIFNRFYRGDRSRQGEDGESGLGLAIAKSLVVAHGGEISVSSAPESGTTFTIFLPG